jgi:hypothetical protein
MRIVAQCGFEKREAEAEGIITLVGNVPSFFTTVLPADSKSTTRVRHGSTMATWVRYFYNGSTATGTPTVISQTEWGFHFRLYQEAGTPFSTNMQCGVSDGTTEVLSVGFTAANLMTIRVNGSVVATSVLPLSLEEWERIHVTVDNQIGGDVNVYIDGDFSSPVVSWTLLAALTNPNCFYVKAPFRTNWDDLFCWEMGVGPYADNINELGSASIEWITLTGAGTYTDGGDGAGGTGVYTAIDERPVNDSDLIDFDGVDQASTFTNSGTTDDKVFSVELGARSMRAGTVAGANLQMVQTINAVDTYHPTVATGAPADGHVILVLEEDAETNPWTKNRLLNSHFGVITRT